MHRILRHRPSPAMIVACVALFISLGGTSYAAVKLPAGSVGTKQLQANAVVGSKVKAGSLTLSDISAASLSKLSRVAYHSANEMDPVEFGAPQSIETVSLTVPAAGFVLVQGWVNAYAGEYGGEVRVTVRDDTTSDESEVYSSMYLEATEQGSTGNSAVFPVTPGVRSFSVRVSWSGGGILGAAGSIVAQFIPYDGAGGTTP